jgi:hypothetical protein
MSLLIILNIVLMLGVIILFFTRKHGKKNVFSSLEDIELIEFQQNLKDLIDQLHKVAETKVKEMEIKKKEIEDTIVMSDAKINELKYLIERNQLIRKSEYKAAIAAGPLPEEVVFPEFKKKPVEDASRKARQAPPARFVMNEMFSDSAENAGEQPAETENNKGKNKYEHINSLIKNGLSVDEISKVTGLSRGEIELIRNIKR